MVLATNRPGDLDAAILDRMDESLEFGLPGLNERQKIISQYVDLYIVKAGTAEGGAGAARETSLWRRFLVSNNPVLHALQLTLFVICCSFVFTCVYL